MANSFQNVQEVPEMGVLSELAENLVYRLPGCADLMIRKTIQEVYRDFCRRSCCLLGRRQFTLDPYFSGFALAPRYGGLIESVTRVRYNDRTLAHTDYTLEVLDGIARVMLHKHLVPSPLTTPEYYPTCTIDFVEIPKMASEKAPSWFIGQYGDAIVDGVLARLMVMTNRAWTDIAQAQVANIRYENTISEARLRYYQGSVRENGGVECRDTSELVF